MSHKRELTHRRLKQIWENDNIEILSTKGKRYVIFSDLHLGNGGGADNFVHNQKIMNKALRFYKEENYNLILLGDIEEFWQFSLDEIKKKYGNNIYKQIREFGDKKVYRVFGNHDIEWKMFIDPVRNNPVGSRKSNEALKMKDINGNIKILLLHGHQGSLGSDRLGWFSRFFVRLFRPIEAFFHSIGFIGENSSPKSRVIKEYEQIFYDWAKKNKIIIICGHSHRAIFASTSYYKELEKRIEKIENKISKINKKDEIKKLYREKKKLNSSKNSEKKKGRDINIRDKKEQKPCYFNSGCGCYKKGITAIEIIEDEIQLVKWNKYGKNKREDKHFNKNKGIISEFISQISGT